MELLPVTDELLESLPGVTMLNGGRRAWCESVKTYVRSATLALVSDGKLLALFEDKDDYRDYCEQQAALYQELQKL